MGITETLVAMKEEEEEDDDDDRIQCLVAQGFTPGAFCTRFVG
jgi:hypothetical protein